jgi:hypothetical protein
MSSGSGRWTLGGESDTGKRCAMGDMKGDLNLGGAAPPARSLLPVDESDVISLD